MTRQIDIPVLDSAPCNKSGRDKFTLFDTVSDMALAADTVSETCHSRKACKDTSSWMGEVSWQDAIRYTYDGDMRRVAPSDALLSKYESLHPSRSAWRTLDDVTGAVPNVPAFLAGTPLTMRRRSRVTHEQAPLSVVVDIASSGGIDASDLEKRGAAILALVRSLSAIRPVELWVGVSASPSSVKAKGAWHVFSKIDTAPLDLGRAAHVLCCPAVPRAMLYGLIHKYAGDEHETSLSWPYGDHEFSRKHGREMVGRVMGGGDVFYIAPPYISDALVNKPEAWLAEAIKTWGGLDAEA